MRLHALELVRFGAMQNVVLRLARDKPFHLAYAPNEAGKSTLRRGLLALLFGISNQDGDAAVFHGDTKVAGHFETATGIVRLTRHKRLKSPLVTNDQGDSYDGTMEQLQLGWSREAYERAFALDHHGLRAFSVALRDGGPLAAFAASELGGIDVGALQRSLEEAATNLATDVATRSKKKEIALALEELKRLDAELATSVVSPLAVASARDAVAQSEAALERCRTEERAAEHAVWRAEQRAQLSQEAESLQTARTNQRVLAPLQPVSEEALAEARALEERALRVEQDFARLQAECIQIESTIRTQSHSEEETRAARALLTQHRVIESLIHKADELSDLQSNLRECTLAEEEAHRQVLQLGIHDPIPLSEAWILHLGQWRDAAQRQEQHRSDTAIIDPSARVYTDEDLDTLERALALAEMRAAPDALRTLEERCIRAEKERDDLASAWSPERMSLDLPQARLARDKDIRAHWKAGIAAEPKVLEQWLVSAATLDEQTDALLLETAHGARHVEAVRAATLSALRVRSELDVVRELAAAAILGLQETLRSLGVMAPKARELCIRKAREATERLRRALAKLHEEERRAEAWQAKDHELRAQLQRLDQAALRTWGIMLGEQHYGIAERVASCCQTYMHAAHMRSRVASDVAKAYADLSTQAQAFPKLELRVEIDGKIYTRQLVDMQFEAQKRVIAADAYTQALNTQQALARARDEAELEAGRARAACRDMLATCVAADIQALVAMRARTQDDAERRMHIAQLEAAITAGAARIGLSTEDAFAPSAHVYEAMADAGRLRDAAHAASHAVGLRLQSQQRVFEQLTQQSTHAIEISEQRAATLALIEDKLGRYIKLRATSALLKATLLRHRDAQLGPLLEGTSRYLQLLTDGAYNHVTLDEHNDTPTLLIRTGTGRPRGVDELSDGTRDQLGLAARLAYEELHPSTGAWPLLLDDILVHFDDKRAANALRALAVFCKHRPILLLTHHAHVLSLARQHVPSEWLDVTAFETV